MIASSSLVPSFTQRTAALPQNRMALKQRTSLVVSAAAAVEFIPYVPVDKRDAYALRLLQPHPVAKTFYQRRDEGFIALGSYMSGANSAGSRFVETQPIVMTFHPDGLKTMSVYLVPRETAADDGAALSAPTDATVALDAAGGELVAVLRFEGNATQEACKGAEAKLRKSLVADGLQLAEAEAAGLFRLAQYGPLHSLSTRVNEIWLTVKLG